MASIGGVSLPNVIEVAGNLSGTPDITPVHDAGAFLQDWITNKLPGAIISLASSVAGREDGSGALTNQAIKMGTDKNLFGGALSGEH